MTSPAASSRSPSPELVALPAAVSPPPAPQRPGVSRYLDQRASAPVHPIPLAPLLSVEYPGYIQPSPASLQRALFTIGGPTRLETLLEPPAPGPYPAERKVVAGHSAGLPIVELNYSLTSDAPEVIEAARWKHPVLGQVIDGDKLVLRVRKRRKVRINRETGERERLEAGEYTMDVLGPIAKTVRFRNIADHQYAPPTETPTAQYLAALRSLDHDHLLHKPFPPETEEYVAPLSPAEGEMDVDGSFDGGESSARGRERRMRSTAGIFPPPMFSMQRVPYRYNYKPNPYSSLVALANPGEGEEEEQRLSNRGKNKIIGVSMVKFHPDVPIPTAPPAGWKSNSSEEEFLERLHKIFAEPGTYAHEGIQSRPIWSRAALANQFAEGESGVRHRLKLFLPGIAYTFEGGAYRDLMIRLGYDPRDDPVAGPRYQGARLRMFHSTSAMDRAKRSFMGSRNVRHYASSFANQKLAEVLPGGDIRKTHLFDGIKLHRDWQNFQLCDVSEPELVELIDDRDGMRGTCFGEDGWYKPIRYTLIREILRRKFNHLLASGTPLPAGSCDELKAAAELEQLRADGQAVEIEPKSEDDSDPGWVGEGGSSEDEAGGKGKGRAGEKAKAKAPRKAKRKTLNALIHPSSAAKSRKNVGRTRARQVGVTDAVEMAERLQRDLEREARLTANGVI